MTEREWVERYADKVESTKVSWHSLMNRKKWNGLEGDAQTRYEEELKKKAEKPVFRAWKKDTFQEISKDTYTWAKAKGL